MTERNLMQIKASNSDSNLAEKFRSLLYQILDYENINLPRLDFLKEISNILLNFSGSDTIKLWLQKEDEKNKYKAIRCTKRSFSYKIISSISEENKLHEKIFSISSQYHKELMNNNLDLSLSCTTQYCSLWINNIEDFLKKYPKVQFKKIDFLFKFKKNHKSFILIPLKVGNINFGILQLISPNLNFFSRAEVKHYEEFAQTLGLVLINQRAQAALRERVKELTCLYGISQAVERHGTSFDDIFTDTVNLLPSSWQYPKITQARIIFDEHRYTTSGFQKGVQCQEADIVVKGKKRGEVEVWYTAEKFHLDEGPFLKEERHLINTVAKELALIIERKEAERDKIKLEGQLRHADRLATVGQLTAGVAHELNEPLGNILGFSQLAMKCPGLPQQAKMDIEKIITASLYSREVIKKLMLFTRQAPSKMIKVDLNQVVEDGLYFLESRCNNEGIEVKRSLSANLPKITADSAQLQQVLVNLVVNAIHAMPDGGTLKIQTHKSDNQVSLFVEDTGIGMKEGLVKQIFIPFFTTKDIGEGTGLGLSVVHGIVTSHGGTINVWSDVGQGTRFKIVFPVTGFALNEEK